MDQQSVSPIRSLLQQRDILLLMSKLLDPKDLLSFSLTCKIICKILVNALNIRYLMFLGHHRTQYEKLRSFEQKVLHRKKRNAIVQYRYNTSANLVFLRIDALWVKNQNASTTTIKIPKYLSAANSASDTIYCMDCREWVIEMVICESTIKGNKLTITRLDGDALSMMKLIPYGFSLSYSSKYYIFGNRPCDK